MLICAWPNLPLSELYLLRLAVTEDEECNTVKHLQEAVSAVLKEAEAAFPTRETKGSVGSLKVDSGSLSC